MVTQNEYIEKVATQLVKLAVTSRMARVPLEAECDRFLGLPVRAATYRFPSKTTRLYFACGLYSGKRDVVDQSSKAIHQAARTLVRRVISEAALDFVFTSWNG
jgi:hypothetical protein